MLLEDNRIERDPIAEGFFNKYCIFHTFIFEGFHDKTPYKPLRRKTNFDNAFLFTAHRIKLDSSIYPFQ